MRASTAVKRAYQNQGIPVLRAIQDGSLIRLTVPAGTGRLVDEVRREDAFNILGRTISTKQWVWVRVPGVPA